MSRVIRKVRDLNPGDSMVQESIACPTTIIESIIDGVLKHEVDGDNAVMVTVDVDICVSVKTSK